MEYRGLEIVIEQDLSPQSPREWDNLGVFAFFHRNYKNESDIKTENFGSLTEIQEHIEKELNAICVPVYLYSHSGDTINTTPFSCPWDSGQLGFAYITKEKAREEMDWKLITQKRKNWLLTVLKDEINTFDQFIRGEVYGFTIKRNGRHIDSCWGFYGYEDCLKEAKENADYFADNA